MLIVLPNTKDGLPGLLTKLLAPTSLPTFKKLFTKSAYSSDRFFLYLPRFTLGGESTDLKACLRSLGLDEVFSPQADFSGINEQKNLCISSVMHQAVLEVRNVKL